MSFVVNLVELFGDLYSAVVEDEGLLFCDILHVHEQFGILLKESKVFLFQVDVDIVELLYHILQLFYPFSQNAKGLDATLADYLFFGELFM